MSFRTFNRTVKSLDLAHNIFDLKAVETLGDVLMANRVITKVNLQDWGLTEPELFEGLLKKLKGRGKSLEVPFPRTDLVEAVLRDKTLDREGLDRILGLWAKVADGDTGIQIPSDTVQRPAEAPPEPGYRVAPGESSGGSQGPATIDEPNQGEWAITFPPVPPGDVTRIWEDFRQAYSVEKLLGTLRGSSSSAT
jgi:hypothetical protein